MTKKIWQANFLNLWWLVVDVVADNGVFDEFVVWFCWVSGGWRRKWSGFVGFVMVGGYCWFFLLFFFLHYITVKYFSDYFPECNQTQEKDYFPRNHLHLQIFYSGK
jgi:hypothetical protein